MEDLTNCRVIDFGILNPGKVHTKEIKFSSKFLVTDVSTSKLTHPLDEVFSIKKDPRCDSDCKNRFIIQFSPALPHRKFFEYMQVHFEDGNAQKLYIKGETKGPNVEFSVSKIHFHTNSKMASSRYIFTMENFSDCDDYFCWDFVPEDSEVKIKPFSGIISGGSRLRITVIFTPRRIGLFYRPFPCVFKFQEPLFIEVCAFHSKKEMKLDLNKYVSINSTTPIYLTNFCRYMSDVAFPHCCLSRRTVMSSPPISQSRRYINFGRVAVKQKVNYVVEYFSLTNNSDNDLVVIWDYAKCGPFRVEPAKSLLRSPGISVQFSVFFGPTEPDLFCRSEIQASFLWGLRLEYTAPFSVRVQLLGDSFTNEDCRREPNYSIERTRIVLPGTIPNFPTYTVFQICKKGLLPLHFKIESLDETNIFSVKPKEGLIKGNFQLIIIQLAPSDKVDVIYKEDWLLTLNQLTQVKLEICGSCELPFLQAGANKDVVFPPAALGACSCIQIPIKNSTRLELEYQCQKDSKKHIEVPLSPHSIGPGETKFVEFCFRPTVLGTSSALQGIRIGWEPYHSAARKSLEGRRIGSETVLKFSGTAEKPNIHASTNTLTISNVFLHDWAVGKYFLSNESNSTVFIRLKCEEESRFSEIGKWTLTPNDITLRPRQVVEIKLNILAVKVGRSVFPIKYALFESHLFQKEAPTWTNLLMGEIFVLFSSLAIIDIRYEGLAKSLSKHVLWSLLEINKLNGVLNTLETNRQHTSSMKIPDYHLNTPPLDVEFLLKNTSSAPLWLQVTVIKNCKCPLKRNDSISRRVLESFCPHDDQLTARVHDHKVLPEKTTLLSLNARYAVLEECRFTLMLSISRCTEEDTVSETVDIHILVDRGIIKCGSNASINFLLPPSEIGSRLFKFQMEDIYIGDPSKYLQTVSNSRTVVSNSSSMKPTSKVKYIQLININYVWNPSKVKVIWLYNHSQKDCSYWAEWIYVNNKVWQILNPQANVPAYSSRPLLIEFTPYELKTFEAMLRVVDELGEEFHVSIEGNGSFQKSLHTARLLNKMPPLSQFNEPDNSVELSVNHIVVNPMPTHSFDKYIFFMKNNSKEIIYFSWDRLIVWSTVKVLVRPHIGEIQPGEIFPFQMHIHSYRFPAIFNCSVECVYYSKTQSEEYWENCRILKKASTLFDSCFTLVPDKDIEITYKNPSYHWGAGEHPRNKILSIGASLHVFNREQIDVAVPSLPQQLKFPPPHKISLKKNSVLMRKSQSFLTTETLRRVIRSVVESTMFKGSLRRKQPHLRYVDLPNAKSRLRIEKIPGRQMSLLLANILYSALLKLFGLDPYVYHDVCTSVFGKVQQGNTWKMFNEYYEKMLNNDVDQICIPPEDQVRIKRTHSRDQLAYVQRASV